jgi:DNA-binding response OmpR family regulator
MSSDSRFVCILRCEETILEAEMDYSNLILLVDDDASIQDIVVEYLADNGYNTKTASNGEEAIDLLRTHKFSALVIDISFGPNHIKGWDVARRARAINSAIPVIYITGGNSSDWAIQGVPLSTLLTKPFAAAQLVTAISQHLNSASSY